MTKKKYLWGAIILLIIGSGYYWYKKTHPANTQAQYVTATAEKGTLSTSITGSGNVIVDQQTNIDPTITGTVSNLAVAIGDPVEKGQVLFNIVNDQLGVSVSQARSSHQSALSSFESAYSTKKSAQASYISTKKLSTSTHADKVAAQEKIDAAEAGMVSAQQGINSALANLNFQRGQAGKRAVTAPISGTVNSVNIKNGDDLSKLSSGSSRQVPMIIGDLGTLKAQVQINEVDVPNVQIGQKATMTFNSVAELTVTGKVEKIDSLGTVTQGVVIYNATISFDTLDPRIKPGMSVSAAIITGVKQDVVIVPNSAVKTQSNNNYVEVLNSGTTPQQVTVEIGVANNTETEIVSGINVDDKVVTRTINPNAPTATSTQGQGGGGGFGGGALRGLR